MTDHEENLAPRLRLVCAVDPAHLDLIIFGTPLPIEFLTGFPSRCPFSSCPGFLHLAEPPEEMTIENVPDGGA